MVSKNARQPLGHTYTSGFAWYVNSLRKNMPSDDGYLFRTGMCGMELLSNSRASGLPIPQAVPAVS